MSLDDSQIAAMRQAAQQANIDAAKAFGFGGYAWTVVRTTGDGVASDTTQAPAASVSGYAYRSRPSPISPTDPQTGALDERWYFILVSGTLQIRDVLTSSDDGRQLAVEAVEPWYDYHRCTVELVP
jgi:hypothetical protein